MTAAVASSLAKLTGRPYADAVPDRDLITRFHQDRDESAFAALVGKHGPMVLGVCRRKLRDCHAADDAFQATFLVLARKAGRVAWQESLGGWLYRVAERVCRKALGRKSLVTAPLVPDAHAAPNPPSPVSELTAVLDDELLRLPATYRDPIILCHLEGMTVDEAAAALGVSDGQLRGRLHRGREKLRERLGARGVSLGATALAVALTGGAAKAVPAALASGTTALAVGTTAGAWAAAASTSVLTLAQEGVNAMSRLKLNLLAAATVLAVAVLGVGVHGVSAEPPAVGPNARVPTPMPAPQLAPAEDDDKKDDKIDRREGVIKSVDSAARKLVLVTDEDKFELTVELTEKAEVLFARRPTPLTELKAGMRGHVEFKGAEKQAFRVEGHWPKLETVVKSADAAKNSLTVKTEGNNGFEFEAVLAVAAEARVEVEGLPGGLADLPAGTKVRVEFAADKKTVVGIDADAEKGELTAAVKSVDAAGKSITLTLLVTGLREERPVELSFAVAADAKVRVSGKDAALADLIAEMPVRAKFAADRRTITAIWAAPPRPKEKDDDAPR